MSLNNIAAADFKFFRAFVNGNDDMYSKFIKDCPSELEGISTIRSIVDSFKQNVIKNCSFVVLCNSVLPAINNITICRNFFNEDEQDTDERKNFKKTFNHEYSEKDNVLGYSDCVIYSEDAQLTSEFLIWSINNKLIHRSKTINYKDVLYKLLDYDLDFLESVMDVDKTGKNKDIPWKHLPCLPIYIENEEIYSTFDFSFVFDDDGQTYLNRYDKSFKLIERAPYKKLNFGD